MNALGTFFRGLWRGLDGLRKFLHLLLLLLIFGFIFGALRVSIPKIPTTAALIVAPEGQLVEQLSGDPLERAFEEAQGIGRAETLLWDVVDSVRAGAKDDRIKVLVLDLDYLAGAGQPALEELARAIREFRATGKQVISYGTMYLQDQYYLAAQANEIYLDPLGFVLIDGYDRYRWFWKGTIDKLGVQMNVFRVGAYKSAVEVYTRTEMSPEEREESLVYLNSLWGTYQRAITNARKLKPDAIANYVGSFAKTATDLGGKTAQIAMKAGLVTGLRSRIEVEQRLIELVGEDETTGSFRAVTDQEYSRIVKAEKALSDGEPTIGVVVAAGEILDGEQPPGTVGGDSTARLIRDAREDDSVKAIVLRVDSPGGSVTASEQIYRELMAVKRAGMPVVVSMGSLAASGGYYISAPADEIWAHPATLTGSIGIFAVVPTFSETMGKAGITVDGVGTTPLSGQLRVDRPLGEEAQMLLQSTIKHGYEVFLERVSTGREKTRDQVDAIAQGRVWSGIDAKRVGLVDQLGSFDDAVKAAAKRAKLPEYRVEFVQPELSWAQELALQVKVWGVRAFGGAAGAANRELKPALQMARQLDPIRAELERLSRFTMPNRLYAYCFCAVH